MYIGLDVGGTYLKGARIDGSGSVVARHREPVARGSAGALLTQLVEAVTGLAAGATVQAVGIGLPGIVDHRTGRVRVAPNLPVLQGQPVSEEVTRRTGLPAFTENDANAGALAEHWLGAGKGAAGLLYLTLGTGVGGGIVLDGKAWSGQSGYAGEIGHIQVDPDGIRCGCGSWGCLETLAGAAGWRRQAEAALERRTSSLRREALDPTTIAAAARAGDAVALDVVDGAARALGIGLAATLDLLNLDRVVVGGGVAGAGPVLLDRIVEHTRRRAYAQVCADCTFVPAALGKDAGVIGAARVAILGTGAGS